MSQKPVAATDPVNGLSFDVEEYFQVANFVEAIPRASWDEIPRRAADATRGILDLLDRHEARATFFTLGWLAEKEPDLVREIVRRGHELASHGWEHRLVYELGPDGFRDELRRSKAVLEDLSGQPVVGYRASNFSITAETPWALEILLEEGSRYDSSIFPVKHPRYGIPGAQRFPHLLDVGGDSLVEIPLTTLRILGRNVPVAGGAYLRLFPLGLIRRGLAAANRAGQPGIVYLHPWEFDPEQPRVRTSVTRRLRHYTNLSKTAMKLGSLLAERRFVPLGEIAESVRSAGSPVRSI
ncbi:MAG: DUF3473 domain-containing protein [Planctomycetota bacterium]